MQNESAMTLRVALFTDTLDETNGVANTYQRLRRYAEENGLRLDIYCPAVDANDSIEELGSTRVMRFRPHLAIRYYEHLQFSFFPNPRIEKTFDEFGPYDIVQVAAPGNLGLAGRALAKKHKLPSLGVHHTQLQDYAAEFLTGPIAETARQFSTQILKSFYSSFDRVLCTTPAMEQMLKETGLAVRTSLFSRGVDTEAYSPSLRTRPRGGRPVRLFYAGRISPEKNLKTLMTVADRLHAKHDVELVLAGDGPIKAELEQAYPWAKFLGYRKGADLAAEYADADIFVFPSLTDTFGNVVQEALASQTPAVVMDRKGPGEIVRHGETGLIGATEKEFEAAIESLVIDDSRRLKMGENARIYAESRNWDNVFDELWSTYAETIAEHRARRNQALPT